MINTRTAASTALYSILCGGKSRWGFDSPKSGWAWTHSVPSDTSRHIDDASLDLVKALGCPVPSLPGLSLHPDEVAGNGADLLVREIHGPFVILHQGAGHPAKIWEPDHWAHLADWVAQSGFTPVFTGSAGERTAIQRIQREMSRGSVSLAGRCDLSTFAEVIRRSLISVDSASMHMAVAMQTPVVALFGPTDSRRWGPYPNGVDNVVVEKRGGCAFCKIEKGCLERSCMKMIGV